MIYNVKHIQPGLEANVKEIKIENLKNQRNIPNIIFYHFRKYEKNP